MWTPSYDIIVETLTGSEFEVTVNDRDTVGYLKSEIQKYEGIPISQQHLLYNHKELSDAMEMKDIPLVKGSRIKLVLGMKGGPISSKRLFTISSDYDNWLDMSDVLSGEDLMNLQSPGLKLLLYKDNKKNVHRLMKVRAEKACDGMKGSMSRSIIGSGASGQGIYGPGGPMSQKERDAAVTKQKMDQIKAKLSMKKKRLGGGAQSEKVIENGAPESSEKSAHQIDGRPGSGSADAADVGSKVIRNSNHYRHKKRHHHYHHHQHQHETVIKEEKTPIGYRPGAGGSGGATALVASRHNPSMVGTIGSMLPSAGTASGAHRKSMPAVIDIGRSEQEQTVTPFGYGLVNLLHGTSSAASAGRSPTLELEKRSQIREHLQRNRSFKTISSKNLDFAREGSPQTTGSGGLSDRHTGSAGLERSLSFHSNGILSRMGSETTLDAGYSNIRRCTAGSQLRGNHTGLGTRMSGVGGGGACTTQSLHKLDESRVSSASLHDLIELLKYTQSKQRTISNDSLNKLMLNYSKKVYVPHQLYHHPQAGKKSLPEINPSLNNIDEYLPDYDYGLKASAGTATTAATASAATTGGAIPKMVTRSEDGLDCKIASAEYAFKNAGTGGMDKSFRTLYKSTSDDSSVYELPKLLIREDSPVESFLGSYSQLETVAATRRGESPKNNFTSTTNLQDVDGTNHVDPTTQTGLPEPGSILDLRPLATNASAGVVSEAKHASESLLQLAQIAAESVNSSNGTNTSLSSSSLFGSNNSLTGVAVCGDGTNCAGAANSGSSSAAWCQHWNHQQQQDVPFTTASLQHLHNPRRHHSDLGINELELKFFHTDVDASDRVGGRDTATNASGDYTNLIKLPAISNLGASNGWLQLSSWDTVRFGREDEDADDEEVLDEEEVPDREEEDHEEEDDDEGEEGDENGQDQDRVTSSSCSSIRRPRESSNSTSFIHSHLSISSDEDDLLNVAELRDGAGAVGSAYKPGGNKSKSIDLNEFRKAFGSSPTLLNGFRGGASCTRLVPQLSRLETIPSQYRRGYTNLNDACLSSSTSELECVSNGAAKKKHQGLLPPTCDDTSVLSSTLLKYRKDGSVPYVRSNENLNRYKVSLCSGSARRRMVDSDETLAGGSDALYLRQRQQSIGGTRHLPSIRDHLASIADSEVNETADGGSNGNGNTHSSFADENGNANRSFVVGGDFECRFSRLSCCSAPGGDGPSKPFSPGSSNRTAGSNYRHKEHSSAVGSSRGLMRTKSSASTDDRCRFLFGEDATSLQYNGNPSSTPLRPSDYYFPSDESLFNMDSFFDDFVEIDTSDIFESAEFININSGSGSKKGDTTTNGCSSGLVLPDIHSEQHQRHLQQQQQLQNQKHGSFTADETLDLQQHQLRVLDNMKSYSSTDASNARKQYYRTVNIPGGGTAGGANANTEDEIHFSARRAFLQAGQSVQQEGAQDEEGIASIIQHIDRDQLCEQRASLPDAKTIASSIIIHDDKERLLRLTDNPSDRSSASVLIGGGTSPMAAETQHHTTEQIKSKKLRCAQCNKKLGVIMIMKCHCEKIFCAQHRYAEAHNCSYDFKVEGRKILEKNNPLVVADKLPKI